MKITFIISIILSLAISALSQNEAEVISQSANLREKPSLKSKIILKIKKGVKFQLESEEPKNGWYFVSVLNGNQKGWILASAVKITIFASTDEVMKMLRGDLANGAINEWLYISGTKTAKTYFNPSKVIRKGSIVEYWIKNVPFDKQKYLEDMYKLMNKPYPRSIKAKDFIDNLVQYRGDCKDKKSAILKVVDNWLNKPPDISVVPEQYVNLESVIPESYDENWLTRACAVKL